MTHRLLPRLVAAGVAGALLSTAGAVSAVETQSEWDSYFDEEFPSTMPETESGNTNEDDSFAWQAHYWLRAYLRMASLTGDTKYLDRCVGLIDYIWDHTDEARVTRGELSFTPYDSAPLWLMQNPTEVSPSWRRPFNGQWRIEVLNDGMVLQGMSRFIHLVERDERFADYRSYAAEYLPLVEEVIAIHDANYSYDKQPYCAGSYYYTRADEPFADWGDPDNDRLYNAPRPYNHAATMAISLLLLDDLYGRPEYKEKARGILQFWKDFAREEGGAYVWDYDLAEADPVEDVGHGHIDVDFLVLTHNFGITGLTDEQALDVSDMQKLVKTVDNFYVDGGDIRTYVDGSGSTRDGATAIGYGYTELARIDAGIIPKAEAVFDKHNQHPSWSREFLGWAEIMWAKTACSPSPEACDGVDNDCDGWIDEGIGCLAGTATPGTGTGGAATGGTATGETATGGTATDGTATDGTATGSEVDGGGAPTGPEAAPGASGGCSSGGPVNPKSTGWLLAMLLGLGVIRRRSDAADARCK